MVDGSNKAAKNLSEERNSATFAVTDVDVKQNLIFRALWYATVYSIEYYSNKELNTNHRKS